MAIREAKLGAVAITGASTGIGRACALYLDRLGFRVYAGVRKATDGDRLKAEGSDRLTPLRIDITDGDAIAGAVREVEGSVGGEGLWGLVNNAGIVVAGPIEILPMDEWRRQFEVNVLGHVAVTQAFLPLLRNARGRIVNMGSVTGRLATPFAAPYAMTKFAMEAFTDSLRVELKPWGIEVAIIEPGSIATPIWDKSQRWGAEAYEKLDEQARALYGPQIEKLRTESARIGARGISPDRVARAVGHALTSEKPKTRYPVGFDGRVGGLAGRWIPDRLRDYFVMKHFGLDK